MVHKDLLIYVNNLKKKGVSNSLIKEKLIKSGYPLSYVNKALRFGIILKIIKTIFILIILTIILLIGYHFYTQFEENRQTKIYLLEKSEVGPCNAPPDETDFEECYWELGNKLGFDLKENAGIVCSQAPIDYQKTCFHGMGFGVASGSNGDGLIGIKICGKAPKDMQETCYTGFFNSGREVSSEEELRNIIEKCNTSPDDLKSICAFTLGTRIALSNLNISNKKEYCSGVEYRTDCYAGFDTSQE